MGIEKSVSLQLFTERDIPRFNKETIIRRWMRLEDHRGAAFIDSVTNLEMMAESVMKLYVETGHRQQNPYQFK